MAALAQILSFSLAQISMIWLVGYDPRMAVGSVMGFVAAHALRVLSD